MTGGSGRASAPGGDGPLPAAAATPIVGEHVMFGIWEALRRTALDRLPAAKTDADRLEHLLIITNVWQRQHDAAASILRDIEAAPEPASTVAQTWMRAWNAAAATRTDYDVRQAEVVARLGTDRAREIAGTRVSPVLAAARQQGQALLQERRDTLLQRRAPVVPPSTLDELTRLAALHASGALSDEEFTAFKARLLED